VISFLKLYGDDPSWDSQVEEPIIHSDLNAQGDIMNKTFKTNMSDFECVDATSFLKLSQEPTKPKKYNTKQFKGDIVEALGRVCPETGGPYVMSDGDIIGAVVDLKAERDELLEELATLRKPHIMIL